MKPAADFIEREEAGKAPGPEVRNLAEKAPWWGGDLQTLAHRIMFRGHPIPGVARPMSFAVSDGTGDRMTGTLHDPGTGAPLVVLLHGVAGSEESVYMWDTARHLVKRGWPVLRLNHRAAGSSVDHCALTYQCAGTREIADVLGALPEDLTRAGLFAAGFSMGGTILLNLLAQPQGHERLSGAMTISAPLDLVASAERIHRPRNFPYQRALLAALMRMEREFRQRGRAKDLPPLPRPTSLRGYDHLVTAPRHGFAGAEDYYRRASPAQRLSRIDLPVTLLHAEDDPWITADPYRAVQASGQDNLQVILTPRGGHVGFHFRGSEVPFFAELLEKTLLHRFGMPRSA